MSSEMSKPTMYSLIATGLSFLALIIFYAVKKPDFVMEEDSSKGGKKVLSIRLSLVYALLFSSAIGLLVLGSSSLLFKSSESYSSKPGSIELPTIASFKYGAKGHKVKLGCCA